MSTPTASSSGAADDDNYDEVLEAVKKRFRTATKRDKGSPALFVTEVPELYQIFLEALPDALRPVNTCSACRRFVNRYGGIVRVDADGKAVPVLWDKEGGPEPYAAAIRALAATVARAPIRRVFISDEKVWGQPQTGEWTHFSVTPGEALLHKPSLVQTAGQAAAEKTQDYKTLEAGLEEFPLAVVKRAHSLLTTGALYRSEKCIGAAKWLLDLHERRQATQNQRERENLTWHAAASAPAGFCHIRSSMIGTLLEDLVAELPFDQIKTRFDAKMHPLQYQRPTAPPSAGNIAQAEKIIAKLKAAGSLERRFAKLSDIKTFWTPKPSKKKSEKKGVFAHLLEQTEAPSPQVDVPAITMTWDKFSRTVLPTAESIDFLVPAKNQPYLGLVTAKNPDAPPIVQWDSEEERNPVTWYLYVNGSTPARWNLKAGVYHPVTAVALAPSMWNPAKRFDHQGEKAIFILKGARDTEYKNGAGMFPEFLKSELHPVRATIEAYTKNAIIEGKDEAEACGIVLQKGVAWDFSFRVTAQGGVRVVYKLDRWD